MLTIKSPGKPMNVMPLNSCVISSSGIAFMEYNEPYTRGIIGSTCQNYEPVTRKFLFLMIQLLSLAVIFIGCGPRSFIVKEHLPFIVQLLVVVSLLPEILLIRINYKQPQYTIQKL